MEEKTIYALGFFDGVHRGHQALLAAGRRLAQENRCQPGVVTFASHPDTLVTGKTPPLINSIADRQALLRQMGMARIVTLPFDRAMMEMHYRTFVLLLVKRYQAGGFVCGHDFRFGAGGAGTPEKLAELCEALSLPCAVVPEQRLDGVTISSTHIRRLLEAGEMTQAARFLGHPHILSGIVSPGQRLGRTLGIPTANLLLPKEVLCPRRGVYACKAWVGEASYLAVTNIGNRPTVGGGYTTVESWLLDFAGELYGRELRLDLYRFLRPEQKFASLEALQAEIQKNAAETRKFFAKS